MSKNKEPETDDEEEEEEKEILFLMEFLVDTLTVFPEKMQIGHLDPCVLQGQNCLTMTFLNFPPMHICEKDLNPCRQTGDDVVKYNSGKSLTFALSQSQFEKPPLIYLGVTAHKLTPHGCVPPKLNIGQTRIEVTELFTQVFDKLEKKPEKFPASKSVKDTYQLLGETQKKTAELLLYVRLSCLGQNIVTSFQKGDGCEPLLYKNIRSTKVYECQATTKEPVNCGETEDMCPPVPGYGHALEGPCVGKTQKVEPPDEDELYDEYGDTIPGHKLQIKVLKSNPKPKTPKINDFCHCELQNAQNQNPFQGNHLILKVPPDQTLCKKGGRNAIIHKPNSCSKKRARKCDLENDPNDDVFYLKIGQKGDPCGKGRLDLELRTPIQVVVEPPPEPLRIDQSVQTDKVGKERKK